ncbi:hypothetical protein N1851_005428 [Merluccius polli]|uniref:DDE Tnp4 domain-containing protein n=1 Tax=Merluccius polli TaxID=89951 RepID=A0AA47P6R6_MERPO|nr:hypothetical protein N1851_005428 [Merluccius polli]
MGSPHFVGLQDLRYHWLIQELRLDFILFQRYFRLDTSQFDELLARVGPRIAKLDTSRATVRRIVPEVAEAIFECLVDDFMLQPTKEDWRSNAEGFHHGSMEWKTCGHPGSTKFWLQGDILSCRCHYHFRFIDVGGYGRTSDGGILSHSRFGEGLMGGTLDFPKDKEILGAGHHGKMLYYLVGPVPGSNIPSEDRLFNYLLSRARLTVECSFGILSSQWRMYRRVVYISPEKHEGEWKQTAHALRNVGRIGSHNATREALRVREAFRSYFNQEGAVPWQHQAV